MNRIAPKNMDKKEMAKGFHKGAPFIFFTPISEINALLIRLSCSKNLEICH
jgi:hypothetical protein